MFLGYAFEYKGYHLWNPNFKKVIQSRHITFNETVMFFSRKEFAIPTCDQQDDIEMAELEVPLNAPQIQYLILIVRTILKNLTLTAMTSQVLKSSRLQITTPLVVIGHEESSKDLHAIPVMLRMD